MNLHRTCHHNYHVATILLKTSSSLWTEFTCLELQDIHDLMLSSVSVIGIMCGNILHKLKFLSVITH
jgi:esterase/lipase